MKDLSKLVSQVGIERTTKVLGLQHSELSELLAGKRVSLKKDYDFCTSCIDERSFDHEARKNLFLKPPGQDWSLR